MAGWARIYMYVNQPVHGVTRIQLFLHVPADFITFYVSEPSQARPQASLTGLLIYNHHYGEMDEIRAA
jgi:hypothetical protein